MQQHKLKPCPSCRPGWITGACASHFGVRHHFHSVVPAGCRGMWPFSSSSSHIQKGDSEVWDLQYYMCCSASCSWWDRHYSRPPVVPVVLWFLPPNHKTTGTCGARDYVGEHQVQPRVRNLACHGFSVHYTVYVCTYCTLQFGWSGTVILATSTSTLCCSNGEVPVLPAQYGTAWRWKLAQSVLSQSSQSWRN